MKQITAAGWDHFQHVADIGVRGFGARLEEAFEQAALALTAVIVDPEQITDKKRVKIEVKATDNELLLIEWLNALVYEMATRRMLFGRFRVKISDGILRASAWGEPIKTERHHPAVEVKGATFTELKVAQDANGVWFAQCVVDV